MKTAFPSRQFATEADIVRLGEGLLSRTLPKAEWTHEAHFAATLYLLLRRPDIELERELPDFIRRYNEAVGGQNTDTSGYHETLTQLYIGAIRAHVRDWHGPQDLLAMGNALVRGPYADRAFPLQHWSRERLFSVNARRGWVTPDLMPLPFELHAADAAANRPQ